MMIIRAPITSKKLLPLFRFCTTPTDSNKSYVMPEKNQNIMFYEPTKKLNFKNGRCLIFLNKQNLTTPFLLGLHYTIPLSYIGFLIATNPFYLTFPAALPLMFIVEGVLLIGWLAHKSHLKRQVERIYLLNNGIQLQIFYSNKIRRMVKDNDMQTFHLVSEFQNIYKEDEEKQRIKPIRGLRFPQDTNIAEDKALKPLPMQYGWTARDKNFNNFIIPSNYDYANWEILTKVLNGVKIYLTEDNFTNDGLFTKKNHPTVEEQYNKIAQYEKQDGKQRQQRLKKE